jgi:hypothetical protein
MKTSTLKKENYASASATARQLAAHVRQAAAHA